MDENSVIPCSVKDEVAALRKELETAVAKSHLYHQTNTKKLDDLEDLISGIKAVKVFVKFWLWVGAIAAAAIAIIKLWNGHGG